MAVDFKSKTDKPITNSIIVDAECDQSTGVGSYQVMDMQWNHMIYRSPDIYGATNNLLEFLALVHGLAFCKKEGLKLPVYTDSQTAIAWVMNRSTNTTVEWGAHNKTLKDLCIRAIQWLIANRDHNEVLKWKTKEWGENPADFGNKKYHK